MWIYFFNIIIIPIEFGLNYIIKYLYFNIIRIRLINTNCHPYISSFNCLYFIRHFIIDRDVKFRNVFL